MIYLEQFTRGPGGALIRQSIKPVFWRKTGRQTDFGPAALRRLRFNNSYPQTRSKCAQGRFPAKNCPSSDRSPVSWADFLWRFLCCLNFDWKVQVRFFGTPISVYKVTHPFAWNWPYREKTGMSLADIVPVFVKFLCRCLYKFLVKTSILYLLWFFESLAANLKSGMRVRVKG